MKKLLVIIIFLIFLVGCEKTNESILNDEKYYLKTILDDNRSVYFTFEVPYNAEDKKIINLPDALSKKIITIEELEKEMHIEGYIKDGGSILYKYNGFTKKYGKEDFYMLVCNSIDGKNDIFIAKNIKSLNKMCMTKTNN